MLFWCVVFTVFAALKMLASEEGDIIDILGIILVWVLYCRSL